MVLKNTCGMLRLFVLVACGCHGVQQPMASKSSVIGLQEVVYANEDHTLEVRLERVDVLLKSADEILNFPCMIEFEGKLVLAYGRGQHGGKEGRPAAVSTDRGATWRDLPADSPFTDNVQSSGIYGHLRDGTTLYVDVFPREAPSIPEEWGEKGYYVVGQVENPSWRVRRFSRQGELVETFTARAEGLPWELAAYENYGTILELPDGDLLAAFQCHLEATTGPDYAFTTFIARSPDGGKTFRHVQTLEPIRDGKKIGSQGLCEPDMAILPSGDILCILRTGHYTPMYQSRSRDGGKTWSLPRSTGWPGVKPKLRVLPGGVLACSAGRGAYGHPQVTHALFSIDGTGEVWEPPFIFHTGPGCSYTWNIESDGKLHVIYSHSDFWDPIGTYGLPYQSIKRAVLSVEKEPHA